MADVTLRTNRHVLHYLVKSLYQLHSTIKTVVSRNIILQPQCLARRLSKKLINQKLRESWQKLINQKLRESWQVIFGNIYNKNIRPIRNLQIWHNYVIVTSRPIRSLHLWHTDVTTNQKPAFMAHDDVIPLRANHRAPLWHNGRSHFLSHTGSKWRPLCYSGSLSSTI